jgi:hypothetical protein
MAVKFNKEMLIKQRFWIMLGTAVLLTFGGILCLEFVSAEETINAVKSAIQSVKAIKSTNPNQTVIDAWAKEADNAKKAESKVWSKAYDVQEHLFKWAPEVENKFHFYDGLFATDIKLAKGTDQKAWPKDTIDPKAWSKGKIDPKAWPKDTLTLLVHGTVEQQESTYFVIKTRTGEMMKFYATPGVDNITLAEGNQKPIFAELLKNSKDRYAAVTFQRGRYFGDMLTSSERTTFAGGRPDINPPDNRLSSSYKAQIRPILQLVDPLDDKGNGVVQLKGWLFKSEKPDDADGLPHEDANAADQRFISYVKAKWDTGIDFSKGAWIAQEDLWIQREIYQVIRDTNKTVSEFKKQPGSGNDKVQIFKNSYFELHLTLLPDGSIDFKAKNLLNRRQRLDQKFLVKTIENGTPEEIKISADPLMPKGDAGKKDSYSEILKAPTDGTKRKGIFEVRQVLTWETAAVKRIDQISIGSNASGDIAHGHRTYVDSLRPFLYADIGIPDDLGGVGPGNIGAAPQKFGQGPKGQPGKGGKGAGIPGRPGNAMGAAGANMQKIAHDLWLTRYVEVSDQSRRIPVAIALIIDQDHVDRVLTHFNNSKLRFLETQVILNHYPASLQPLAPPDAKNDPGRPAGPGGFFGQKGPGLQSPGTQSGAAGGSAEMETNMEIVIYGIMTLYQRYPQRPVVAPPAGTTPPPAEKTAPPEKKADR